MFLRAFFAFAVAASSMAVGLPITHQDMWTMRRVGAPAVSPNGKWVAFPVIEPAYDEKDQVSDLWIAPADASAPPRRLTATKGPESGVTWSPDSRYIAFSAKRGGDEVNQIYVQDTTGGEAVRITSLSMAVSNPRWRPDGKALLFQSAAYPGAKDDAANKRIAAERKARKYKARVYDSFPIRYWDHWLDDTQQHVFVQILEPGSQARDLLAGTRLSAEPGFGCHATTTGEELDAIWTPDGQSVIFAATTRKNTAAYAFFGLQLYQTPAAGGEPRLLTVGDDSYFKPAFRPDGKALYCLYNPKNDQVYNSDRLVMFSWPWQGHRVNVTATFDRSVDSFAFGSDSKTVYLLAEDAGLEKIYLVPAGGGAVRPLAGTARGCYSNLSSEKILAANWESAVNPAEVVRVDPAAGGNRALSNFNAGRVTAIDWQPLRHFSFTSRRGKQIHNMIVIPPAFDEGKKYPLLVIIHGGPHNMWKDQFLTRWNYHLLAQPGYVVLLTDYAGSTGYGEKFAQEIQGDPLKGPGDEINEAADEAIRRFPFIDASRQAAAGASYGGHLANWLQATTTRYKCLISHAGLINLESQWGTSDGIYHREVGNGGPVWEQGKVWREQNPIRYAKNFRTPILLSVGERDFRVPLNQTLENWSVLQRLRIPSRLIVWEEENHWISKGEDSRYFYQEVHAWLKKYLD